MKGAAVAANLHLSKQNGLNSLFELSSNTHQAYYRVNSPHPYLSNAHSINPISRNFLT